MYAFYSSRLLYPALLLGVTVYSSAAKAEIVTLACETNFGHHSEQTYEVDLSRGTISALQGDISTGFSGIPANIGRNLITWSANGSQWRIDRNTGRFQSNMGQGWLASYWTCHRAQKIL
jgi:hypothetical protein